MQRESNGIVKNDPDALKRKVIVYVVGLVLLSYIGILFSAAWTPNTDVMRWFDNFVKFVLIQHHFIVGFTKVTPIILALIITAYTLAYLYAALQIKHPYMGREFGDAKWGTAEQFTAKYANHDDSNLVKVNFGDVPEPSEPVYVNTMNYWVANGVFINLDNKHMSNLNIFAVGPPGTGKTFRLARPVLSQLAGNFLVTDPKLELSTETGQFMEDNGYEVMVLNIESEEAMANSIHFNPFRYLTNESSILSLSQILFKATTPPDAGNLDVFFEGSAEVVLTSIFYLMFYTYTEEEQDWKHFVELLDSTTVKANPKTRAIDLSDPNCIYNRFKRADEDWRSGKIDGIEHEEHIPGFVDIEKYYTGAQETTSSIIASLDNHCKYMKLKCVQELLSEDDIRIEESFGYCKKNKRSPSGKRILYIGTSEDKRYFDWITSMVYALFFDTLYHLTTIDPSLNKTLPIHLTFLMDEFNNITLPDDFVDKLSTMRSRGMSVIAILQNLMQLRNKFPNNDMDKNFLANFSTTIILGGPDEESCEILSKMFGNETINKQTTGVSKGAQGSSSENEDRIEHPLLPPHKIFQMDKDGPLAMVVKGADPLWEPKVQFQDSPLLPLLTRKNPYVVKKRKYQVKSVNRVDYQKSPCERSEGIQVFFGVDAEHFISQCDEDGIEIIKLSESDVDALSILNRHNQRIRGQNATTKQFWKDLHQLTEEAMTRQKANEIDYDLYSVEQMKVIQKLRNMQFSVAQIKAMNGLILSDYPLEDILEYFGNHMSETQIKEFSDRLVNIREKEKVS